MSFFHFPLFLSLFLSFYTIFNSTSKFYFHSVILVTYTIRAHLFQTLQCTGFLQLVGCLGALRLSEKLLNAYWLLLLVLLIGDAVLGIFWMFKFDRIMHELQPMLRFVFYIEFQIYAKLLFIVELPYLWHLVFFAMTLPSTQYIILIIINTYMYKCITIHANLRRFLHKFSPTACLTCFDLIHFIPYILYICEHIVIQISFSH